MNKFWRFAPWLTRLILLAPTFIFALIASKYIVHPAQAAAAVGITLDKPLAATILRIGFGAFPLSCSIFTLSCLVSTRRILTGLGFVSIVVGVALIVRVFGMLVDGTVQESMGLVVNEAVMLLLFIAGVFIERGRRNKLKQATPALSKLVEIPA
jgi:hypothetical protein